MAEDTGAGANATMSKVRNAKRGRLMCRGSSLILVSIQAMRSDRNKAVFSADRSIVPEMVPEKI